MPRGDTHYYCTPHRQGVLPGRTIPYFPPCPTCQRKRADGRFSELEIEEGERLYQKFLMEKERRKQWRQQIS